MTYDEAETKMREAGAEHGRNAASWYFDGNTPLETYRTVARGILDGDPEVMDTLPNSPLSGEWADEPTPSSVFRDVLDLDLHAESSFWGPETTSELLDAYEEAFDEAVTSAVMRDCNIQLDGRAAR